MHLPKKSKYNFYTSHFSYISSSQARRERSPVLMATGYVKGKWQNSTPSQIRNPWTDRHKIWNRW